MNYGSVCSGMEAATCAWHPLGWTPAFVSEIDPTASRLLVGLYPDVPNLGDMTKFQEWPDYAIDLLVGGTPCQSFSIAGLRKGLADPRGNLMLTYLAIVDRYRPRWLVWENVPGVLSSNGGRDFGTFLGGLGQLGYGFAYRVLDAQYVRVQSHPRAVPQRRRRVFVVGHLGDWRRAAAVLFERESLSRHPPPRREAGKGTAHDVAPSLTSSGRGVERGGDARGQDPVIAFDETSRCLNADAMGRIDWETETFVAHTLKGEGFDASEDGTGRGTPIVPVAVAGTMKALRESGGFSNSADHAAGGYMVPIAYRTAGDGAVFEEGDKTAPLTTGTDRSANIVAHAYDMRGREGGAQFEGPHDTANIRAAGGGSSRSYVAHRWAVRRLTPLECLRLQGFPDDYFDKARLNKPLADGPKYKMLGNSMAVNVMSWIGQRIQMVEGIKA